jgi:hypothetical protein
MRLAPVGPDVTLYESVANLELTVESSDRRRHGRDTSSGFTRVTTEFHLHGAGETGRGEDVCYDAADHDALDGVSPFVAGDDDGRIEPGTYTFAEFSAALDDVDAFPGHEPEMPAAANYRRWALESAGLDLALRQAGETLGEALGRAYDPVRFVASSRLADGDPDRVEALLAASPGTELKLDPTDEWTDAAFASLADSGAVRVLDLKGFYEGTEVDQDPDPDFYERVFGTFPDAVVEDPAVTPETEAVVEANADRLSWDYPIASVDDLRDLPYAPRWCNLKPSRFGSVESLFDAVDYCRDHDVAMYGGGQFELGVGRPQIQALAALCYPDGPNDVAPGGYNDPEIPAGLPTSPLAAPEPDAGIAPH